MFQAARRVRLLAAVGLVLALAQGRAWGQEPIWERAADVLRRICELPCVVAAEKKPATEPPPAVFSWECKDPAEWSFAVGNFLETIGDYERAYARYKSLASRYPRKGAFVSAVQRVKEKHDEAVAALIRKLYPQDRDISGPGIYQPGLLGHSWVVIKKVDKSGFYSDGELPWVYLRVDDLDIAVAWLIEDDLRTVPVASLSLPQLPAGECGDAPICDDMCSLIHGPRDDRPCPSCVIGFGPALWAPPDPDLVSALAQQRIPKTSAFPLSPPPGAGDHNAPALPQRKDMLPDSDHGRSLIELGVIAGPGELLSMPQAATTINFDRLVLPGGPIIF
jgi:hypothetical protein